jgi:hypothetical protein
MLNNIINPSLITGSTDLSVEYLLSNDLIAYAGNINMASTAIIFPDVVPINAHCNVSAPNKERLMIVPASMFEGFSILNLPKGLKPIVDNKGVPTGKQKFYETQNFGDYHNGVKVPESPELINQNTILGVVEWARKEGIKSIYSITANKPYVYTREFVLNYTYFTVNGLK